MTDNSFGKLFSFTSFGESHGIAIGCIVDGAPSNLLLNESLIQPYLDRRRPGTSKFVTQRQEMTRLKFYLESLKEKLPAHLLLYLSETRTSEQKTMMILPINTGQDMLTTPIRPNTASAIIVVVADHQHAKLLFA